MPNKLAAVPGEVGDIFTRKSHHPRLIRKGLGQDEACPMSHDRQVRPQPQRLGNLQMIITRWNRHDGTLLQQRGDSGRVISQGRTGEEEEAREGFHSLYLPWRPPS